MQVLAGPNKSQPSKIFYFFSGSLLQAPYSRLPTPGSLLQAPYSRLPTPGSMVQQQDKEHIIVLIFKLKFEHHCTKNLSWWEHLFFR
jgi:hypothetical protein